MHPADPPYLVDDDLYQRFSESDIGFNAVSRDLKQPWYIRFGRTRDNLCRQGQASIKRPLAKVEDAQIMCAHSQALGRFDVITTSWGRGHANRDWLLWEPEIATQRADLVPLTDAPRLTQEVKRLARASGACGVRVAAVDPRWFYADVQSSFADPEQVSKVPLHWDDVPEMIEDEQGFHLPKTMNHVIALLIPMDAAMMLTAPSMLAEAATNHGYAMAAQVAVNVAGFVRSMGYHAAASLNGTALSIPIAIDAGLGELGRNGMLITPERGPCVRICKVFTDMPLVVDQPVKLGVQNYCKTCDLCSEACPPRAVAAGERTYKGHNECNNDGVLKWHVNAKRCLRWWVASGTSCSLCLARCPYTWGKRWFWGLPQAIIRRTSALNGLIQHLTRRLAARRQTEPDAYFSSDR